ncbi:hypothetical protein [uncultured Amnibacterium sp.]|uniref:hypothetical protein n=1 Tax=uncultured Amnibacterium sp. TaxID=1631851 RepID=UPI0035CB67AC
MGVDELARLRRIVYGPNPDPESRRRYEELLREREAVPPPLADDGPAVAPIAPIAPVAPVAPIAPIGPVAAVPRRRRALVIAVPAVVVAVALVVAAVQATTTADRLPLSLSPPALSGATIVAYGNQRTTRAAAAFTRYEPFGYTVFQPSGGSLHLALRCVGNGTVVITAGQRFPFTCTGPERVLHLDDEHEHVKPFVVVGITKGDVVWAVRITERPPPDSSVANPSKRFGEMG